MSRSPAALAVSRSILQAYPGLQIAVEGSSDSAANDAQAGKRAESVRQMLVARGLAANHCTARGLGDSRPLVANSTAAGREQNRRVEIVISGDPIGTLPFWDRTYSLTQTRRYKSRRELTRAIRLVAKADLALRSNPVSKRLVLERLIMDLTTEPKVEAPRVDAGSVARVAWLSSQ